jgi:hypothetical protein
MKTFLAWSEQPKEAKNVTILYYRSKKIINKSNHICGKYMDIDTVDKKTQFGQIFVWFCVNFLFIQQHIDRCIWFLTVPMYRYRCHIFLIMSLGEIHMHMHFILLI